MSLKQELNDWIKINGFVSLADIHKYAEDHGFKQSNAERALRRSLSPEIETVKNTKGFITGYKYESEILKKFREAGKPVEVDNKQQLF